MTVRMKDIAEKMGVSLMTVSKALRNHGDVAEETRRRVLKCARELRYEPNLVARSLAHGRSYLVGMVVPDLMHSFFAEVAKGVETVLEPRGYQIVMSNSGESAERELRQIRLLLSRKVDGLIIASAATSFRESPLELLQAHSAKYVLIDRSIPRAKFNFVGVKDEEIAICAADHLIQQGCRRIAHIAGPGNPTGIGRLRGFRRAMAKRGLPLPEEYIVRAGHDHAHGYAAMQKLLQVSPRVDGVFCYNDDVASGALNAILQAGLSVPRDIAVIGVGDVHYSDQLRVPLSTINQRSMSIGEMAAELLLNCIEAKKTPPLKSIFLEPQLVARESTQRVIPDSE
jgi:LacI family transcriptional regulator